MRKLCIRPTDEWSKKVSLVNSSGKPISEAQDHWVNPQKLQNEGRKEGKKEGRHEERRKQYRMIDNANNPCTIYNVLNIMFDHFSDVSWYN